MSTLSSAFDWYFIPRRIEKDSRLYKLIGVEVVGKIVRATAGSFVLMLRPRAELYAYFVVKPFSLESINRTERWSRFNEIVHLLFTGFCVALAIVFWRRSYSGGTILMGFFAIFNLYLVLLQRFNRTKLLKMKMLIQKRHI